MDVGDVLRVLKRSGRETSRRGMAKFGIHTENAYGVSIPVLRSLAKRLGTDHSMALGLWASGIHEARILASMIDDPEKVTGIQMDRWVRDFNSWDLCDQCCSNLFDRTPAARRKALAWSSAKGEFVKRAGFSLMAVLAVHDREATDAAFVRFFASIRRGSTDGRNFVKKAVNWALRQIGKRNLVLNRKAVRLAREIQRNGSSAARWVAGDALRELTGPRVQKKLRRKTK